MTGLFVQLDTEWVDNPKLIRAGIDGAGLHATALCIAKRLNTDGWIDRLLLVRYGASDELIDRLVDLRLLEADGDRVRPWGWLDRNPSQGAIAAMRATKRDAAKRGNHTRWGHDGEYEECPKCNPNAQVVAGCDRTGSGSDPTRSPETESETDTETYVASDRKRSRRKTTAPDSMEITDAMRTWAASIGAVNNLESEMGLFLDWHASKGTAYVDWNRTWQTWMRKAVERNPARFTAPAETDPDDPYAGVVFR